MVILACLVLVAAVAYSMAMEGLAEALIVLFVTLIAGFIALAVHQSLANFLGSKFAGSMAEGTEDALALVGIFCLIAGGLRWLTQAILPWQVTLPPLVNQIGGAAVGSLSGWLAGGILTIALATLPWHHDSWGMDSPVAADQTPTAFRTIFPSDLVWLAGVRRISANSKLGHGTAFDDDGSYLIRFGRHRTGWSNSKPQAYSGEPYSGQP